MARRGGYGGYDFGKTLVDTVMGVKRMQQQQHQFDLRHSQQVKEAGLLDLHRKNQLAATQSYYDEIGRSNRARENAPRETLTEGFFDEKLNRWVDEYTYTTPDKSRSSIRRQYSEIGRNPNSTGGTGSKYPLRREKYDVNTGQFILEYSTDGVHWGDATTMDGKPFQTKPVERPSKSLSGYDQTWNDYMNWLNADLTNFYDEKDEEGTKTGRSVVDIPNYKTGRDLPVTIEEYYKRARELRKGMTPHITGMLNTENRKKLYGIIEKKMGEVEPSKRGQVLEGLHQLFPNLTEGDKEVTKRVYEYFMSGYNLPTDQDIMSQKSTVDPNERKTNYPLWYYK